MNPEVQIDERGGWTSASNAEADMLCPGRHLAQKGFPDRASKDATFGDRVHEALSKRDPAGLTFQETETFNACLAIEVRKVREFFPDIDLKLLRSWPEKRYWIKFQVQAPGSNGQPVMRELSHSCRPDRVYRYGDLLLLIEYKTLAGDVAGSPRNLQVRDQAVICRGHFLAKEVGAVVIQPLVSKNPDLTLYQAHDLDRGRDELFRRVTLSNDPGSNRVPGEAQCKFCLARLGGCMEHQRWQASMVPRMLDLLEVPVNAWTAEQRAIFCDRLPVAQKWLDDIKAAIYEGAKVDPAFVQGYRMVPGAVRNEVNNPQTLFERFIALGGESKQFMAAVYITKSQLKEQVATVTGGKGKALDKTMAELLQGITTEKQNKASLKRVEASETGGAA